MGNEHPTLPPGYRMTELGPLPEEWRVVRLGEVGKVVTGRTPPTSVSDYWNGSIPFITPVDLDGGLIRHAARTITEEGLKHSKPLPKGTVLVSCIGYIGKIGMVDTDIAVTNQQINAIIPHSCDNWFLAYALMQEVDILKSRARMTTVPILHKTNFENIPIPLPPLPEQRAIAHVLRTVQEAMETTERVVAALRDLKKSLMRHLFTYGPVNVGATGRSPLRETEIGPIPEHWRVVRLGEVCGKPRYGFTAPAKGEPVGPKLLRITDIQEGQVNWATVPYCDCPNELVGKYALRRGDLLFARTGSVGKVYLIKTLPEQTVFASYLIRVRVSEKEVVPEFVYLFMQSASYWQQIGSQVHGAVQPNVNATQLRQLLIPLPPLPEQQQIAAILQAVDRRIQAEENCARALETLFRTLLHDLMTARRRLPPEYVAQFATAAAQPTPAERETP